MVFAKRSVLKAPHASRGRTAPGQSSAEPFAPEIVITFHATISVFWKMENHIFFQDMRRTLNH
jgi:hypothetical protein